MPKIEIEKITALLSEAQEHATKFLESPKLKEYSFKVAAQLNLRNARKLIDQYNKELTEEYRTRKLASKKEPKPAKPSPSKPAPSATPAPSEETHAEMADNEEAVE